MSIASLVSTGTKVWLDGVEPGDLQRNHQWGITGATSNPAIVAEIIKKGHFNDRILELLKEGLDDQAIAWALTDQLVEAAQDLFLPVWEKTRGDDGYVSFELDPLIEDPARALPQAQRVQQYIELGRRWSAGHRNRMIKVPATPAGLEALEPLAAAGLSLNVTLMFTQRQYLAASEAVWRGAQRRTSGLQDFKSVYSIFVSRIDVYTEKHHPNLSPAAQGQLGILNAKRVWQLNQQFWRDKRLRLKQEVIFASTGVKKAGEAADKYVSALAGSDIQTNPAATNEAVEHAARQYAPEVDHMPPQAVMRELDQEVDTPTMERVLMEEGTQKFADPQKQLLALIAAKRSQAPRAP